MENGHSFFVSIIIVIGFFGSLYVLIMLTKRSKKLNYYIYKSPAIYFYSPLCILLIWIAVTPDAGNIIDEPEDIFWQTLSYLSVPYALALILRLANNYFDRTN